MLAPVSHILALTLIRRVRMLPVDGRVLVRAGQKVNATDAIAEAYVHPKHIHLEVTNVLGGDARRKTERRVGEELQEGDIIASSGGFFRREIRAPFKSVVKAITASQVLLEERSAPFVLRAGMAGEVAEIIPERGAVIETSGGLVQGVWGNGQVGVGSLISVGRSPDEELNAAQLQGISRGALVVAGMCSDPAVFRSAEENGLRGLVLGSMDSALLPLAADLNLPVMLVEGFGQIPMNEAAFKVLSTNEKHLATLNAIPWDNFMGDRPELIIPLPVEGQAPPETDVFRMGQGVRINAAPYAGEIGILEQVLPGQTLLPNGVRTTAATVTLEGGSQVTVPLANMDVIE